MKIEASTRLKLTAERLHEYLNRLTKDLNIKSLGSGAYAEVFQHPTMKNVVVKVLQKDPNYLRYAEFCMAHPKNPWLPKIAAIVPIELKGSSSAHLVFLEKLEKCRMSEIRALSRKLAHENSPELVGDTRIWFTRPGWLKISKETKDKGFAELAGFIADPKNYKRLDLHGGNLMKRGPQLVFTDPLS